MDDASLSNRYLSFTAMVVPQAEADQAIQRILSRIAPKRFRRKNGALHLARIYDVDPPSGGAHLFRLVAYSPRQSSAICVLVTNLKDGWNSLCHLLAKEHCQLQFQVKSTRSGVEWPLHSLQVWTSGQSVRLVRAMRDSDGWDFFQKGELQEFEEKDLYEKRIVRQRLDREAIVRYLRRVGWDIAKRSFWESDMEATYFEETSKERMP